MTNRKFIRAGTLALLALSAMLAGSAPAFAQAAATAPVETAGHQRLLPLAGGQNFRDLGGYATRDGTTVRWGMLLRSGAMDHLTPGDFAYLDKLGLQAVFDFRSTAERQSAPVHWPDPARPKVFSEDYALDTAGLNFRDAASWSSDQARAAMAASYPRILESLNGQYRSMFHELLVGDAPLAYNCSAGKDRTGVASALILTALDVPRETIIQDYLLSNTYFDPKKAMRPNDPAMKAWTQLPAPVLDAMMGVDRSYIEAVFKVIDAYPRGSDGYLQDRLGVGPAELKTLRERYTTR